MEEKEQEMERLDVSWDPDIWQMGAPERDNGGESIFKDTMKSLDLHEKDPCRGSSWNFRTPGKQKQFQSFWCGKAIPGTKYSNQNVIRYLHSQHKKPEANGWFWEI